MIPFMETQTYKSNSKKLEELEREKARLRTRHTELQPILHRFQQKKTSNTRTRSMAFDAIVKNAGQPLPNSFSTRLNPDFHPQPT
jgi:hypothetical protein